MAFVRHIAARGGVVEELREMQPGPLRAALPDDSMSKSMAAHSPDLAVSAGLGAEAGGAGADPTGDGLTEDRATGAGAGSVRRATLSALPSMAVADTEAPLPLVDAPPRWRLSRLVFGGLVGVGDAVVLAAATVVLWKVARVPIVPGVAGMAGFLSFAWVGGQYAARGTVAPLAATLGAWLLAVAVAAGVLVLPGALAGGGAADWGGLAAWAIGAGVAVLAWRWGMDRQAASWRRQGHLVLRLGVLMGADWVHPGLVALRGACARHGEALGVVLAGSHSHGDAATPPGRARWPLLWAEVAAGRLDGVVVALPWSAQGEVAQACRALRGLAVDVWLLPPPDETTSLLDGEEVLPGVTLLSVARRPLADWRGVAKRAEDVLLGVALLVLFAPTMAVVAVVVALDSRGPILLRQRRFGYGNAPFDVYKFRTMHHDRGDASGAAATLPGDSRVTRSGRFLRASSLDELPQLFNVLKGEMSLVGPRPHPVGMHIGGRLYHLVVPDYAARHRMKPGITGLAQVSGFRGLVDTLEKAHGRLECDLRYIRQWSIAMDLRILWRTVFKGFFGSGAF